MLCQLFMPLMHTLSEQDKLANTKPAIKLCQCAGNTKAAIALESCLMAAIHNTVFDAAAQIHRADDIALHAFLEQLMAGQYDICGTSPDLHVQVCVTPSPPLYKRHPLPSHFHHHVHASYCIKVCLQGPFTFGSMRLPAFALCWCA